MRFSAKVQLFLICFVMSVGFWLVPVNAEAQVYIEINNPFSRKLPLAVPDFAIIAGDQIKGADLGRQGAGLLSEALEFTGFFRLLAKQAHLADLSSGVTAKAIHFPDWTAIGTELLVSGGVSLKGDLLKLELRLFDAFRGRMLVGKRYKGHPEDIRRMIRKFSSDVIYALTGTRGSFDTKIAFVSTSSGSKEIYVCDFDGSAPKKVTSGNKIALSPTWSPDGKQIAYCSYKKGGPHIYVQNIKNRTGYMIKFPGTNITPSWHPEKNILVASMSKSGDPEIYTLTRKGKIIKQLTNNWGIDVSPAWSPDGKQVAFVSNRSGGPQIYIMDVESGKSHRLTFYGRYNTTPTWSPSGRYIAYAGMVDGAFDIYVIRPDGEGLVQLTDKAGDNESPTWSPDSTMLAFSSTREGPARIYVMTVQGSDQRRLLRLKGEQTEPSWSSRLSIF